MIGTAAAETLRGLGGGDLILGGDGDDEIDGGADADTIDGGRGDDRLIGGLGLDRFVFAASNLEGVVDTDAIEDFEDGETIDFSPSGSDRGIARLARQGDDVVISFDLDADQSATAEQIVIVRSADLAEVERAIVGAQVRHLLVGTDADDLIAGTASSDEIRGLGGNDRLFGSKGADRLDGGEGSDDCADYSGSDAGVSVDLRSVGAQSGGDAEGDSLNAVEHLVGSTHADTLTGDAGGNRLEGGDDADRLDGAGGDDTLIGGDGGDRFVFDGLSADAESPVPETDVIADFEAGIDFIDFVGVGVVRLVEEHQIDGRIAVRIEHDATGDGAADRIVRIANARLLDVANAIGLSASTLDGGIEILGTEENDLISGIAAAETVFGFSGDDTVGGSAGADTVEGGGGRNRMDYSGSAQPVTVNLATNLNSGGDAEGDRLFDIHELVGSAGDDDLTGDDVDNGLDGGQGNDLLRGGGGADRIRGGTGSNTLTGGAGVDIFAFDGSIERDPQQPVDTDVITDLDGDLIDLGGAAVATILQTIRADGATEVRVEVDGMGDGDADRIVVLAGVAAVAVKEAIGSTAGLVLVRPTEIFGTDGADDLQGTDGSDRIALLDGDDVARGGDGADTIEGGAGDDALEGGGGGDLIIAGTGSNTLVGGDGTDTFRFSAVDRVVAEGLAEADLVLDFEPGSDALDLDGAAVAVVTEANGTDVAVEIDVDGDGVVDRIAVLAFATRADVVAAIGTTAKDVVAGAARIVGTKASDLLTGSSGDDVVRALAGDDTVRPGGGVDLIDGGTGFDVADYSTSSAGVTVDLGAGLAAGGEAEGDRLVAIEAVIGSAEGDTLVGDGASNLLDGGGGDDTLDGRDGDDRLRGGLGANRLAGGLGADRFVFDGIAELTEGAQIETDTILDFESDRDIIDFGGEGVVTLVRIFNADGTVEVRADHDAGGDGDTDRSVRILGAASEDVRRAIGTTAAQVLDGPTEILGTDDADLLSGTEGADRVIAGSGNDTVRGSAGLDTVEGGAGVNMMDYSASPDAVSVNLSRTTQSGGDADGDSLVGIQDLVGSSGADVLSGSASANRLFGGDGNDTIFGDLGDDRIEGGRGSNRLAGGLGNDIFGFDGVAELAAQEAPGEDTITDFTFNASTRIGDTLDFGSVAGSVAIVTLVTKVDGTRSVRVDYDATDDGLFDFDRVVHVLTSDQAAVRLAIGTTAGRTAVGLAELVGTDASQTLNGTSGSERLIALGGDDTVLAGGGNDVVEGGAGNDSIDGGSGIDTLDYSRSAGAIVFTIAGGLGQTIERDADGITLSVDSAANFEKIVGSRFDDLIDRGGIAGNFDYQGGDGADSLFGGTGADVIDGGKGNDSITGGAGLDRLAGGRGNDTLVGGADGDTFVFAALAGEVQQDRIDDYQSGERIELALNGGSHSLAVNGSNAILAVELGDGGSAELTVTFVNFTDLAAIEAALVLS